MSLLSFYFSKEVGQRIRSWHAKFFGAVSICAVDLFLQVWIASSGSDVPVFGGQKPGAVEHGVESKKGILSLL